jgi:hypothetical protein
MHPAGHGFTELRQPFRWTVTEHAIAHMAHKRFLNRRRNGKVRIGGRERNHIGRLLRPAHVESPFTQEIQTDSVIRKCALRKMVRLRNRQQDGAADLRRKKMPGQLTSFVHVGRALLTPHRRIAGKRSLQANVCLRCCMPKLFCKSNRICHRRRDTLAGKR